MSHAAAVGARWPRRAQRLAAVLVVASAALAGCGRGCSGPPAPEASTPAPRLAAAPRPVQGPVHPASAIEQALRLQLPERQIGELLPGWARLPFRKLPAFAPDQQLVVAISAQGVQVLERTLTPEQAGTDQRLSALLRWATDEWQRRSGLAANRLMLAADRSATPMLVAQVREVALGLQPWRVVALARDGDHLVELFLNPPADRRPSGQPMPMAPAATSSAR